MLAVTIRPENPSDSGAIRRVHEGAFPSSAEATLVDQLRESGRLQISLVAQLGDNIVGHIAFSPADIVNDDSANVGIGLAPLAVLPENQKCGIGSQLVRAGLQACQANGYGFVVVLGAPAYYQRFGFQAARSFALGNEYGAGEEFMALELNAGAIPAAGGLVRYAPEFSIFAE